MPRPMTNELRFYQERMERIADVFDDPKNKPRQEKAIAGLLEIAAHVLYDFHKLANALEDIAKKG